jgi:hypothetical protein
LKQEISPAVIAVIIVVVVVLIGFFGWRTLGPGSKGGGSNPYQGGSHGPVGSGGMGSGGTGSGGMSGGR